jgi:hypothetical protein
MRSKGTIMARAAVSAGALLVTTLAAQTPEVPADFALRLVGGLCTGDTIDTFSETYTRHIDRDRVATTNIRLVPEERQRLFELVSVVGLLVYPSSFNPRTAWLQIPAPRHTITVRLSGVEHTVRWTDMGATQPEAVRLRHFVREVYALFQDRPEVRRLPKQESFCL